jgi:hypothetical protein
MRLTVSELMHIIPTTYWPMNVCEFTLGVLTSPPGQEHVPQDEAHEGCCDEFVSGLGCRLLVNFGCWSVIFVWCNNVSILYGTLLYINNVTFVSVSWVIISVELDLNTHLTHTRVWPPKPGCDRFFSMCFFLLLPNQALVGARMVCWYGCMQL